MEQSRLRVWIFILFALLLTIKAVTAADNAQNSYSSKDTLLSTVPVPDTPADDFQQMLDYLNQTVPRDCDNPEDCDNGTKSKGAPTQSQLVSAQSPVVANDSLQNASYVYSGKEAPSGGSYIRASFAIASVIFVGHIFL